MNHHDAEMTDVIVVLDGQGPKSVDQAIGRLKDLGLSVADVKPEEGVIEGSIDSCRLADLKKVPGVCYVRSVFSYVADFPSGDPRNQDEPGEELEDEDE